MSSSSRKLTIAAAQLGGNQLNEPRSQILDRMLKLLDEAAAKGAKLVVFPELAFTTFFPRHLFTDPEKLAYFFEEESVDAPHAVVDNPKTKPLFDKAKELGTDIYAGYAERWKDADGETTDFNTAIYYSASEGKVLSKYRKIHLPGTNEPLPGDKTEQQLEKRYFTPGNLGYQAFRAPGLFEGTVKSEDLPPTSGTGTDTSYSGKGDPIIGMMICNDRRWAEAWRCYGLQGAELVLEGFNTASYKPQYDESPEEQEAEAIHHHHLSCQHGSYTNACFSVNVSKAGQEDQGFQMGGTTIIDPYGHIIVETQTKGDEVVVATVDLAECRWGKTRMFAFEKHRRVEHYGRLIGQTGEVEPPLLSRK